MTGDRPARPLFERVLLMLVALAMAAGFLVSFAAYLTGALHASTPGPLARREAGGPGR